MNNKFEIYYSKIRKEHTILLLVLYIVMWIACELLLTYRGLVIIPQFIRSFLVFLIVDLKGNRNTSAICGLITFFSVTIYYGFSHHITLTDYYIVSGRITEKSYQHGD